MQQRLVACHPALQHDGDIAPLSQPGILFLELEVLLLDREDLGDRTEEAVESRHRGAQFLSTGAMVSVAWARILSNSVPCALPSKTRTTASATTRISGS
jgi:hypothetical protein